MEEAESLLPYVCFPSPLPCTLQMLSLEAGDKAQWVKMPTAKTEELCLIPWTYIVEEKNYLLQAVL